MFELLKFWSLFRNWELEIRNSSDFSKIGSKLSPVTQCPCTLNFWLGLVVPMPTLPLANTVSKVEVAVPAVVEAIVNSGVLAAVLAEFEIDKRE